MNDQSSRRDVLRTLALSGGICLAASRAVQAQTAGPDLLASRFGGPFSLIRHDGRRVSEADFLGAFLLIYFGFTRCTETCPIDMPMIAGALDRLGEKAKDLIPVFITVDPEDNPAIMRDYLAALHPRFIGLTGSEAELAAAARAYKVHRRKVAVAQGGMTSHAHGAGHGAAHASANFIIDHGSLAYLMGRDGRFLTLFPHGSGIERYVDVLGRYLSA